MVLIIADSGSGKSHCLKLKTQAFWTTNIRKAALFKHKHNCFNAIPYAPGYEKHVCIDSMLTGYYVRFMDSKHRNHYLGFKYAN